MRFNELISSNRAIIMGCAMIAIMIGHQPFLGGVIRYFNLFGGRGVELFLFVSGFGLTHSLQKNSTRTYYLNRVRRIVPPCIIAGVAKYALSNFGLRYFGYEGREVPATLLLLTNLYLWYIYAIIVYYALAPWLCKMLQRHGLKFLVAVCVFSLACTMIPFDSSPYYLVSRIGWITARLPVFVFGIYVVLHPMPFKNAHIFSAGIVVFAACVVLTFMHVMVRFRLPVPYLDILFMIATPMMCMVCCAIGRIFATVRIDGLVRFCGIYSLELYLWHEYFYWNMYHLAAGTPLTHAAQWTITVVLSVITSYATHVLSNRLMARRA